MSNIDKSKVEDWEDLCCHMHTALRKYSDFKVSGPLWNMMHSAYLEPSWHRFAQEFFKTDLTIVSFKTAIVVFGRGREYNQEDLILGQVLRLCNDENVEEWYGHILYWVNEEWLEENDE